MWNVPVGVGAHAGQKRMSAPLELELQTCDPPDVATQVFCKASTHSSLLSLLSNPLLNYLPSLSPYVAIRNTLYNPDRIVLIRLRT